MVRRGFWFTAGAAVGAYGVIRARRVAEALTPDGMRDRLAGLSVAAHLLRDEVRAGMHEKEGELRERMGLMLDGSGDRALGRAPEHPVDDTDRPAKELT